MTDPAGMVCVSGNYKGRKIKVCVDQAEYTNTRRDKALASSQIVSIDGNGKEIEVLGEGRNRDELWMKFAKTPNGNVAGYIFKPVTDEVFPKSRSGFDGPNQPLVNVRGGGGWLEDYKFILGAQELCE